MSIITGAFEAKAINAIDKNQMLVIRKTDEDRLMVNFANEDGDSTSAVHEMNWDETERLCALLSAMRPK